MPLSYQASLLTGLSTLAKVTEYGSDAKVNSSTGAVTGSALPSQSFDASNGPWAALSWSHPGAIPSTGAATPAALGPVTLSPLDTNLLETSPYLTTGDINGDGRTNTVFVPPKTGNGDPTNGCVLTVIIIFGDGDQKPSVPGNPGFPVTSHLIIPSRAQVGHWSSGAGCLRGRASGTVGRRLRGQSRGKLSPRQLSPRAVIGRRSI